MVELGNNTNTSVDVPSSECDLLFNHNLYAGEFVLNTNATTSVFQYRTKNAKVYLWHEMQQADTTYRLISDIQCNHFKFIQIPPRCTIDFNNHYFGNCVLISNNTRIKGLPSDISLCKNVKGLRQFAVENNSTNFEIVGKIYNEQGQPITIYNDLIERSTELLYNYIPQVNANSQYDGVLNNYARRARRLGLYDCLIMANVSKDQYNSYCKTVSTQVMSDFGHSEMEPLSQAALEQLVKTDGGEQNPPSILDKFLVYSNIPGHHGASISGGWTKQGYINTPEDLVAEMYLNGLNVKGIKFHQGSEYWKDGVQEYCEFVLQYVTELKSAIYEFNHPDTSTHPELAFRGIIQDITEVYIANEMPHWTSENCPEAQALADLAHSLTQLGFQPQIQPQISFAKLSDIVCCDHHLYNYVHPNWNFYTRLCYQTVRDVAHENGATYNDVDNYIDNYVAKEFLAENLIQRFEAMGAFWHGRYRFDNTRQIALSEVGCRPCEKSLRATANRNPAEIGGFNECVMPIYWKALDKLAQKVPFKYMVVFFHDWIYNDSSNADNNNNDPNVVISRRNGAHLEERMYEIFRRFGSVSNNQSNQ